LGATEVLIPYSPRAPQMAIHGAIDEGVRFSVVVAHRRMGKTVLAVNECIKRALLRRDARVYYIGPTFKQAKAVAWDFLRHYTEPIPGAQYNETELRADLPNGGRVRLFGADNPDSLRGLSADFVVLDEVGMMQSRVWSEVVRPLLADRKGGALFIGTPAGRNLFWELAEQSRKGGEWRLFEFKASQTGLIDAGELESARQTMGPDEFKQEWECSFEASVKGAIYAAELERARTDKRVTRVPVDDAMLVNTAWDLGIGDATAVIFWQQSPGGEIRLVDYHEASGEGLAYYASVLQGKRYKYGEHIGPHDLEVRELGTGKSRVEQARALGLNFRVLKQSKLEDGIAATRAAFSRMWIDAERCAALLDAVQNYRWDYNQRLDEFKSSPLHDWASHGADALRYLCLGIRKERKWAPIKYSNKGIV
jgi:phage terminase large subunit